MATIHDRAQGCLASSLVFRNGAEGEVSDSVVTIGINDNEETNGPEAVTVFFDEDLDQSIPKDEKLRIAEALISLFNYAQKTSVIGKDVIGIVS